MKLLSIFLFCIISIKTCGSEKQAMTATLNAQELSEDMITLEYETFSRSTYKKIRVIKNIIVISEKRGKPGSPEPLDASEWQKLLDLLQPINLESLPKIKAPSQDFTFDGAPMATLKIIDNEKTYKSVTFDHGNPPKEIESLVKELLSIAENIE